MSSISPKDLVADFVNDKLEYELENLLDFDFLSELEYDKSSEDYKYSEMTRLGKKDDGDPDDYAIVRAIIYLVWREKLPELQFEEIGTGKKYRGDTLNTFRTLLGRDDSVYYRYGFDESLLKKVNEFRKRYLTIGNFLLLPNKSVEIFTPCKECNPKSSSFTLNTWRGSACGPGWFDYFDQFLIELYKCYNHESDKNDVLDQLFQENSFYFDELKKPEEFIQINYLEAYLNEGKVIHRFPEKFYYWWRKTPSEEDCLLYRNFTKRYIDEASRIIQARAAKMLSKLQRIL